MLRGKYILDICWARRRRPAAEHPRAAEKGDDGKALSMREAMARHRANPVCASCHARMDPLGFAMENFDAVGSGGRAPKAENRSVSAVFQDGTNSTASRTPRAVVRRPDQFVIGLAEKLLTYAVGRKATYYDAPTIRAIVREAARSDYRFSTLVMGVVNSAPFQMRAGSQAKVSAARR